MKKEIIMNPKLLETFKGFTPIVGSSEDLSILDAIKRLKKKLASVNNLSFRRAEAGEEHFELSSKMKEIQRDEQYLIDRITRRNLDF